MLIKNLLPLVMVLFVMQGQAQNPVGNNQPDSKKLLTLKEAITLALENGTEAGLAKTKTASSKLQWDVAKNNQYPNLKASGQYLFLSGADVSSNFQSGSSNNSGNGEPIKADHLLLGQLNASMPVFNGFKIKNSIKVAQSIYESEKFSEKHANEQIGLRVVELFAGLYKAQQMTELIKDNLKTAQQRVNDFSAMEQNGLIARNDLLKAQLQESNVALALENAIKNTAVANHELVTLLHLPEGTEIAIDIEAIKKEIANSTNTTAGERNDLKALELKKSAAETNISIAKGNYYPALSLSGGYIAMELGNVLSVTNAMNVGVGVSYDLSSLFKNGKQVKLAQSQAKEAELAVSLMNDKVKEEIFEAGQNYTLSVKQGSVYDKAVEQADENYRIVKDKYDNSLSTTNDLLEADYGQLQAKINQALSKADIAQKYYELQFASGKLITSLNITQNQK